MATEDEGLREVPSRGSGREKYAFDELASVTLSRSRALKLAGAAVLLGVASTANTAEAQQENRPAPKSLFGK